MSLIPYVTFTMTLARNDVSVVGDARQLVSSNTLRCSEFLLCSEQAMLLARFPSRV